MPHTQAFADLSILPWRPCAGTWSGATTDGQAGKRARLGAGPGAFIRLGAGGLGARAGADRQCLTCKEDCVAGDVVRWLPCMHVFHASSYIEVWLASAATCPICVRSVTDMLAIANPT